MARQKKDVDWPGLETAYRAGRSFRLLAKEFGISSTRISQVAEENNWTRDLTAVIAEKTKSKLNAANLNAKLNARKASEREVVEATAEVQTNIVLAHRTDIQRGRKLTMALFEELELQTGNVDLLKDLAVLMFKDGGESQDKRNELFTKVISLSSRAGTMKTLAESLKSLVAMERQAFNIDDDKGSVTPYEQQLRELAGQ
jgi:hypothetical protein